MGFCTTGLGIGCCLRWPCGRKGIQLDPPVKRIKLPMDYNIYATRKTVAQAMMDIALLTANASQLKYLLSHGEGDEHFVISVTLIGISITLQIVVGVLLILLGRWNLNIVKDQKKSDFLNNVIIIAVFLITVVNVLISAFGAISPLDRDSQWTKVGFRSLGPGTFDKGFQGSSVEKSLNRYERAILEESNCTSHSPIL